jgi:hypothetical protein
MASYLWGMTKNRPSVVQTNPDGATQLLKSIADITLVEYMGNATKQTAWPWVARKSMSVESDPGIFLPDFYLDH